jgi:hypothetical protein
MIRNAPPKHPDSTKWYWIEWSADELQNAAVTASSWDLPAGISMDQQSLSGYRAGVRLSGGTDGEKYEVVNTISTDAGETLHETLLIRIRDTGH